METIMQKTVSAEQTEAIAAEFAKELLRRKEYDAFLAMYGDLGAGKTAFVRGLASVIAPKARVSSPTYALVNLYQGEAGLMLAHFDMYRISDEDDLYSIGFYDYENCIIAAEWCENIPYAIPSHHYRIEIHKEMSTAQDCFDSGIRTVTIEEINA